LRKYARIAIAVFGVAFAAFVALQFKRRAAAPPGTAAVRTDPAALVETTAGTTLRLNKSREDVSVSYEKLKAYADGSNRFEGVTITVPDRNKPGREFVVTAREGRKAQTESDIDLDGDVHMKASDGMVVKTEHARYTESDGAVTAPGPVAFSRGHLSGSGVGLRYDKGRDLLTIASQASVHSAPDDSGGSAMDVTSGSAAFSRRDRYVQFDGGVHIVRGGQTIEADAAVARLSEDEQRIESLELHNHSRITASGGGPGSLRSLSGADMTLTYAADGQSLQRALIFNEAAIQLAGDANGPGRQITSKTLDIGMAPDGTTPIALSGRENVQLTFPAEAGVPARSINAAALDAKGEPGRGITRATFTGGVQFRERGPEIDRAASSMLLEVAMKPGMGAIEDARFAHAVRFEEGRMNAQAAAARYDLVKGTLELTGSEPGYAAPHMVTEQIAVDAVRLDVTLEGPLVKATGTVKSTLKAARKDATAENRLPSMLKQDQPVSVLADSLEYDGTKSLAVYTGNARLFQTDTTIKGDVITIDEKRGDLTSTGKAVSTTTREQLAKDGKTKERVQSTGTARDLKYEDASRRLTYTGAAHLVGPEGDMSAAKIELYFRESSDELERAEAYGDAEEKMTLREQSRTTTGSRMTYTAAKETYVVTGKPATVIDECSRETIGSTLTFVRSTDTIVVDGNQQIRTQTKGGSGKCQ
jgi:lipopolysaccharide transport protein LptA/LPS export ABC transporter protein LptC